MKKIIGFGIAAVAALSIASVAPQAHAASSDTGNVTISATIDPVVNLTLDRSTVSFDFDNVSEEGGDSDSDTLTGSIESNVPASVTVLAEAAGANKLNPEDISIDNTALSATIPVEVASASHNSLSESPFELVVSVNNADGYKGSATAYTNQLTFTAVAD